MSARRRQLQNEAEAERESGRERRAAQSRSADVDELLTDTKVLLLQALMKRSKGSRGRQLARGAARQSKSSGIRQRVGQSA